MAKTFRTLLEERTTRNVFENLISAWVRRDLERVMCYVDDDVLNITNVDAAVVPFGPSVYGKTAYRIKVGIILDTFSFPAHVARHLDVAGSIARANMMVIWVHKTTGERLNTNFRLVVEQQDGRIKRVDQYYDAAYVETFSRLISAAPATEAGVKRGATVPALLKPAPLPPPFGPPGPSPLPSRQS